MIVRISGEGQYQLDDALHTELNDLDDATVGAVEQRDEASFRARFDALLAFVRERGTRVESDELRESQFILPPSDLTFAEAQNDFVGDGLIPDPPAR